MSSESREAFMTGGAVRVTRYITMSPRRPSYRDAVREGKCVACAFVKWKFGLPWCENCTPKVG